MTCLLFGVSWHDRNLTYLTHPLVSPASGADPGVGDVEVSPVHLSTPLVAHYRQGDHLQYVLMAGAWEKKFQASTLNPQMLIVSTATAEQERSVLLVTFGLAPAVHFT